MKNIFPIEISEFSYESLFVKNSTSTKIIYNTVIIIILSGFVLLPIIKVNISKQTRGIVRSSYNNNVISTSKYGTVLYINAKENASIAKGDTILIIDTEDVDEKIKLISLQLLNYTNELFDLNVLTQKSLLKPLLKSSKYIQEWIEYQEKMYDLRLKKEYAEREYNTAKKLFKGGAYSDIQFKEKEYKYSLSLQSLKLLKERQQNIWESQKQQKRMKIIELKSNKSQFLKEKNKYIITAPMDGAIINYTGVQVGNIVSPNQKIAEITPMNDLIVECFVSPSDIGLINKNMDVKFQIDAYNYNQWGLATGKVIDISKDLVVIQENPIFKVRCSLDQKYLQLKNTYRGNIKKGLTLTARFIVTKRSLFQLIFDKVDDWLNPKIINNK